MEIADTVIDSGAEAVAIIIALAFVYYQGFIQTRKLQKVDKTLTKSNGGNHVKDQLDRIEKRQIVQEKAIDAHHKALDEHVAWSDSFVQDIDKKFNSIDRKLEADERKKRWFL